MPRCFEKQGMEARARSRGSSVSMRCITKPSAEEEFQERRKEKDPRRDHKYWANSISQLIVEIKISCEEIKDNAKGTRGKAPWEEACN